MKEQKQIERFLELLKKSLRKIVPRNEKIAIAFSGGIDSTILVKLLRDMNYKISCYNIGIYGSHDLEAGEKSAKDLGIKVKTKILTQKDIERALPKQTKILEKLYKQKKNQLKSKIPSLKPNPVSVSFNLPLFFVTRMAKEKYIISGQGPDTMLGGFYRHVKVSKKQAIQNMKDNTKDLINVGYLQHIATAQSFNKKILMPYLDKGFVKFSMALPFNMKIRKGTRKYILRQAARKIGLDEETAMRKKKSAQYGTGIMKIMIKIAKKNKTNTKDYIEKLRV